jgi:hypothetical protein
MNHLKTFAAIVVFFSVNMLSAQTALDKWPAMKSFHEVMSRTFHPAEKGNLEPLKNFSETLENSAKSLTTKEVPAEFKTEKLMASIKRLQGRTTELNKLVKTGASDAELTKTVTEVHDIYHEIVGMCTAEKH